MYQKRILVIIIELQNMFVRVKVTVSVGVSIGLVLGTVRVDVGPIRLGLRVPNETMVCAEPYQTNRISDALVTRE